jgi:C-terminal processing protease CtpA/Prc
MFRLSTDTMLQLGEGRLTCAWAAMVLMIQSRKQLAQLATALGGVPVWGCLPGSAAARLGMRYGDVILSVNGRPTPNVDDYIEARNDRPDGLLVVIFRDGREHTLEVSLEGRPTPLTRAQLESTAAQVAAARLLPSERVPPSESNGA